MKCRDLADNLNIIRKERNRSHQQCIGYSIRNKPTKALIRCPSNTNCYECNNKHKLIININNKYEIVKRW